jgi:hypothetical protein
LEYALKYADMQADVMTYRTRSQQNARNLQSIPAMTMARLKALSQNVLFEQLSGALTSDEMELMLERRDQIVAYFEAMAKRHGKEVVLV